VLVVQAAPVLCVLAQVVQVKVDDGAWDECLHFGKGEQAQPLLLDHGLEAPVEGGDLLADLLVELEVGEQMDVPSGQKREWSSCG